MHTNIDLNDPNWLDKVRENRAEAQQDPRVQAVQAWAKENYTRGADVIVEAFEADEILGLIEDYEATTPEAAIKAAAEYCGIRRERENDIRGYGGLPAI